MSRTVAAIIDESGTVKLLEPVHLSTKHRALLTILDTRPEDDLAPASTQSEMAAAHRARSAELAPGENGYISIDLPFVDDGADW